MDARESVGLHRVRHLSYHSKTNDGQENVNQLPIKTAAAVNRTVRDEI
jgi:hypothetical protein